ncbi:MAG: WG repeat-containing protein [Chitinophagaceae bacterium]|nr:WG repeat-containing protein [Chitinophagaceae bacterium]
MRHKIIFILSFFLTQNSFGQTKNIWVRFYDTTTALSGYKDLKGNITISAKYGKSTQADTFYNIIAVTEKIDNLYKSYYLLKDGRKVGKDSVFMFDFTYDCESEGKILFKDHKKDRVGFLDKNGAIIIPAIYNSATPFYNGLAIVLKNARRSCWGENEDTLNCEHLSWKDGETVLINDKNQILVDSLKGNLHNINWYSLEMNDPNIDTSIWVSLRGNNGEIYSFINYKKEFTKWFYSKFLLTLKSSSKDKLNEILFSKIIFWTNKRGWISLNNKQFLNAFPTSIKKKRFTENNFKKLSISDEDLNSLIFEDKLYKGFYNACGSHNREKYPVFEVMLTYYKKRAKEIKPISSPSGGKSEKWELSGFDKKCEIDYQEHFEFIRTADGYKLLSMSLKH